MFGTFKPKQNVAIGDHFSHTVYINSVKYVTIYYIAGFLLLHNQYYIILEPSIIQLSIVRIFDITISFLLSKISISL